MVAEEKYCVQAKPFRALMNLIIAWRKTGEIIRQSHSIGDTKPPEVAAVRRGVSKKCNERSLTA